MECFICGAKGEETNLFGAVIREGVVKICEGCSVKEEVPIVKGMTSLQLQKSEQNQSVYERLSKMAGVNPNEHKNKFETSADKTSQQNISFRQMVENRQKMPFQKQVNAINKDDLVSNYHWTIFQARRARRLTQKQLADAIGELESSIKLAERGIVPEDYRVFVKKLQTYLGVTLFNRAQKDLENNEEDKKNLSELELEEIEKKAAENGAKTSFWKRIFGKKKTKEISEEIDGGNSDDDLQDLDMEDKSDSISMEEVDRILYNKD